MSKKTDYYMQAPSGEVFRTSYPEYHKECKTLTRAEGEKIYRAQVLTEAKRKIKPGQKIYCTLRSVSSSGMSRRISLHTIHKGELIPLDYTASILTGRTLSDKGGIVCNGCGMDMGFDLVYSLGYSIWPKGTPKAHGTRNGQPDKDGGYALKHVWI
jgi:hypothetical protein